MKIEAIQPQFMTERQGKSFCLYPGLVDAAHRSGLRSIATSLLQAPLKENGETCICLAVATFVDDAGIVYTFSGIGDANTDNVGRMIAAHKIRMAETRAKARALRDALNITVAAVEELGDDDDATPKPQGRPMQIVKESTPVAATDAHYTEMDRLAKNILDTQGKNLGAHITENMSVLQAEALIKRFKATLEEGNAKSAASGGANAQQIDKLHKLQAALGRPAIVSNDLSSEEAARQIAELVRIFNAQAKQKAGAK